MTKKRITLFKERMEHCVANPFDPTMLGPQQQNRDSLDARGLTIHTMVGDTRIWFTPELASKTSIEYITDVVQTAATMQNNGMGNNAAEMMDGHRSTEGFVCKICKWFPVVFFWMAEPLWKMCSRIIELLCFA